MLDIDGKLRCFKTGLDAFTIGVFWYRIRKEGIGGNENGFAKGKFHFEFRRASMKKEGNC